MDGLNTTGGRIQRAAEELMGKERAYHEERALRATQPPPLGVAELAARMDRRLHHKEIMVTSAGLVLVRMEGGWQTLRDDFSVVIDLAPPFNSLMAGACAPATGCDAGPERPR